jgi:hypothetical protein
LIGKLLPLQGILVDDVQHSSCVDENAMEMQWILHCLTAMSGGAEIYDNFDNDDDDAMALWNEEYPYKEEEWDSYIEDGNWNSYEERDDMKRR